MSGWTGRLGGVWIAAGVVLALIAGDNVCAQEAYSGDVVVTLREALSRRERKQTIVADMELVAEAAEGKVQPLIFGTAPQYVTGWHFGRVTEGEVGAGRIRLTAELEMGGNAEVAGPARLVIDLDRRTLAGTWSGTIGGIQKSGAASGELVPAARRLGTPPQPRPGEHPRLLFRKAQIEAMCGRMSTPEGQAILRRLYQGLGERSGVMAQGWSAAARGMLYQLTGDAAQARAAAAELRDATDRAGELRQADDQAIFTVSAALAYDFCYAGWDDPTRRQMASWLAHRAYLLTMPPWPNQDPRPDNGRMAMLRGAGGLALLAIGGDYQPSPPKAASVTELPPPQGFMAGKGMPACELESGRLPRRWIWAGPLPRYRELAFAATQPAAVLDAYGGAAGLLPRSGMRLYAGDIERCFTPLPAKAMVARWDNVAAINVAAVGNSPGLVTYFYTVVSCEEPGLWRMAGTAAGTAVYLAGQSVREGQYVRLSAGEYPLLVEAAMPAGMRGGQEHLISPRLLAASEEELAAELDKAARDTARKAGPLISRQGHETMALNLRLSQLAVRRYMRDAIGEEGGGIESDELLWQAMGEVLFPCVLAHRNVLGVDLASGTAMDRVLPLMAAGLVADRRGAFVAAQGARQGEDQAARAMGAGLLVAPRDVRGPLAALSRRAWGRGGDGTFGVGRAQDAIWAMAGLIEDAAAGEDRALFRPVIVDRAAGLCMFRNAWKDGRDFVVTAQSRSRQCGSEGDAADAGTFLVHGLGHDWAVAGGGRGRKGYNVPQLGEERGSAKLMRCSGRDGVYSLSMDMSDVHRAGPGRRDMLVDYSGRCGSPLLLAVADRLPRGPGAWQMRTAGTVTAEGREFVIRFGDSRATMRGTFLAPAEATLSVAEEGRVLRATGGSVFRVVMTVQDGDGPPCKGEGDAKASVGGRSVQFGEEGVE